ncbi:PLDc N-terminal domain-containing protein [Hoeflea alexandrii]|uniref:PLDc N-terminal domain-containing protein n=1 Tax=Hoeflea alexandrii TaxID=288436 RepID=UPI0022AEF8C5|nr:PLDc N-terminal domain-containing protein [Hoeflea alexandrii]MCZ4288267.1 PLDc N-terminal domain-containing protein [Hoeflea alexandrii]
MGFEYSGILGIIILILDIWAILQIVKGGGSTATKLVWILVILLLPVIGLLIWLLAGRNRL